MGFFLFDLFNDPVWDAICFPILEVGETEVQVDYETHVPLHKGVVVGTGCESRS